MSIRRETPGGPTALEEALRGGGIPCRVETRAGLAVMIVSADVVRQMGDVELRRAALALAKEHGYTHMAIELRDSEA